MLHLQLVLQHKRLLISATNTYMGMSLVIADKRFTLQLQGEHLLCVSKFPSPLSFFSFFFLPLFACSITLCTHIKKKILSNLCNCLQSHCKKLPFFFFFSQIMCGWVLSKVYMLMIDNLWPLQKLLSYSSVNRLKGKAVVIYFLLHTWTWVVWI